MTAMQGALSAAERSMRSVFVGNIPYEATEEQLKDIFSEVGPVVSFRLVYDRETGKPKGYGFCEYKDQEMALSAMRNLNGYELNGRALRVDNAASEKSKEELKNLQASLGGPPVESPYGPEVSPEKAPEVVAKVIASLPPEQLYDFMTQMKVCIENNPNEARTLLIQNPQLAYAMLQAQVVMKIIEPDVAMSMLHGSIGSSAATGLLPTPNVSQAASIPSSQISQSVNEVSHRFSSAGPPVPANPISNHSRNSAMPPSRPSLLGDRPPAMPAPPVPAIGNKFPDRDPRAVMGDHAPISIHPFRSVPLIDHDMRGPPLVGDKDMRHAMGDQDFRPHNLPPEHGRGGGGGFGGDPRYGGGHANNTGPHFADDRPQRAPMGMSPRMEGDPRGNAIPSPAAANIPPGRMPIASLVKNPRIPPGGAGSSPLMGGAASASPSAVTSSPRLGGNPLAAAAAAIAPHDQEKAALIMQVLQLTDQQIAMLPQDQRQSIMVLKEQLARSQQAT